MSATSWGLLTLYLGLLLVAAWPLGIWLTRLSAGQIPDWMRLKAIFNLHHDDL